MIIEKWKYLFQMITYNQYKEAMVISKTIKGVVEGDVLVPKEPAILPGETVVTISLPKNLHFDEKRWCIA